MIDDVPATVKWRQHLTLDLPAPTRGCIWIHACSVGEVGSVVPLIKSLQQDGHTIHLTVVTATGFAHARRQLEGVSVSYLPWDIPGLMRRLVRQLQPAVLLLTETEFWPGMLKACRRNNIPVVGINTRISDRSFPGYLRSRWLWRRWLAPVSLFLAQSDIDAERLAAIGVPQDNIRVAGNMKYALTPPAVQADRLRHRLDPSGHRPILLVASTHENEEEKILAMLPDWLELRPDLLTVIVPRHPQRFDAVAGLIRQQGYHLSRWSDGEDEAPKEIMLIDAMGILADLYSIADIAFIGGSLIDIGGHNPLEASICGRGVVTGPYMQNFRAIIRDMQHEQAAIVAAGDAELRDAIRRLIAHPDELQSLHQSAITFIAERTQVLPRILEAIRPLLPKAASKT